MKNIEDINDLRVREILNNIDNKMISVFGNKLEKVIVYGSYARNGNTSESDLDVMVLVNESVEKLRSYEEAITDIMVDLSLKYNIVVSLYTQSIQEYKKQVNIYLF